MLAESGYLVGNAAQAPACQPRAGLPVLLSWPTAARVEAKARPTYYFAERVASILLAVWPEYVTITRSPRRTLLRGTSGAATRSTAGTLSPERTENARDFVFNAVIRPVTV